MLLVSIIFLVFPNSIWGSYFDDPISDEIQCQCVPPNLCADNDEAANGQALLDIRLGHYSNKLTISSSIIEWFPTYSAFINDREPRDQLIWATKHTFEDDPCPNHFHVCCDMPITVPSSLPVKKCGISTPEDISIRITSESEKTSIGELPWTVLVFTSSSVKDRASSICGGALIHPQVVLTAGHCVARAKSKSVKVRAGEWNIRNKDEPLAHQDESVKEVLLHPHYKTGTLWNDIALLILNKELEVRENVGFICLPTGKFNVDEENCVASGWGTRGVKSRKLSGMLRKVTLPLVRRGSCQKALRATRLGKGFRLHKSFMCAGGEKNKDTCKGDGGSPLICPVVGEQKRYIQVGIVSWGIGCGGSNTPGVYSRVDLFIDWIEKEMTQRNFSTEYYKL